MTSAISLNALHHSEIGIWLKLCNLNAKMILRYKIHQQRETISVIFLMKFESLFLVNLFKYDYLWHKIISSKKKEWQDFIFLNSGKAEGSISSVWRSKLQPHWDNIKQVTCKLHLLQSCTSGRYGLTVHDFKHHLDLCAYLSINLLLCFNLNFNAWSPKFKYGNYRDKERPHQRASRIKTRSKAKCLKLV